MDFHAFSCLTGGGGGNKDRVLLEKVSAITLEHGKMTNARRTSAIPQVRLYGPSSAREGKGLVIRSSLEPFPSLAEVGQACETMSVCSLALLVLHLQEVFW